jgi:hypothetical protein
VQRGQDPFRSGENRSRAAGSTSTAGWSTPPSPWPMRSASRYRSAIPVLRTYYRQVLLAPAWPGIYVNDSERRHTFAAAAAECDRLATTHADLGYTLTELPRTSVAERTELLPATLAGSGPRNISEPS